jgi:hypothetical protein
MLLGTALLILDFRRFLNYVAAIMSLKPSRLRRVQRLRQSYAASYNENSVCVLRIKTWEGVLSCVVLFNFIM